MRKSEKDSQQSEQDPTFQVPGVLTEEALRNLDLPSQALTDEEKLNRRLARAKRNQALLDDSGAIVLPARIPLATIRTESHRAMRGFQKALEESRKKHVVAGVGFYGGDFVELIKSDIAERRGRPVRTGELVSLPYFDWRLTGIVNPPRDQRPCNSCWAHAATAAFESRLMYNINRVRVFSTAEISTVTQIALSVQAVMDCVTTGNCNGGSHTDAFGHFVKNGARLFDFNEQGIGIDDFTTATDDRKGDCLEEGGKGIRALTWDFAIPRNPLLVPRSEASIRRTKGALLNYGALVVNLCIDPAARFHAYQERKYSRGVYDVDPPPKFPTNHNVLLTGWDDERDAWIIVNSFGRDWGGGCVDVAKVKEHFPWIPNARNLRKNKGCMYIKRGVSKVGELAAWIETHLDNEEWLEKARIEVAGRKDGQMRQG